MRSTEAWLLVVAGGVLILAACTPTETERATETGPAAPELTHVIAAGE